MLYVFQVDTGMMMTFEMRLVMETVGALKKAITMKTLVPEDKQVLLISGGECLSNTQRVCSYSSAGTDTSPIFLFAKINIEANQLSLPNVDYGIDDTNITEMIESCMSMQPSLDTLVARTELAADLNDQAIKQKEVCEKLVHDQHLQQQGWAAVTANLEDLTRAFRNKADMLMVAFAEFTKCKPNHVDLLNKFAIDIKHLDDIPVLPALLENNKIIGSTYSQALSGSLDQKASSQGDLSGPQGHKSSTSRGKRASRSTSTSSRQDRRASKASVTGQSSNLSESTSSGTNSGSLKSSSASSNNPSKTSQMSLDDASNEAGDKKQAQTSDKASVVEGNRPDKKQVGKTGHKGTRANNEVDKLVSTSQLQPPPSNISEESPITLRQWIDYHDSYNSLDRLIDLCWRGLDRFTETNAEQIKREVEELLDAASNTSWKEIKDLERRLFMLEELMVNAKKVVDEQCQLASSFQNNRERFSKIKDSTLLPDLSTSHKQQLQMMLTNHKKMSDYRNRCIAAKHELSITLHRRLKWIMYIEQQISDLDGKLMIYKENLLRLKRHFEIVNQVHRSPDLYLSAVVEALRRRRFTRRYLHWANSIAKISQELYENEMITRNEFDAKLGDHFLSNLFPGLTRSYPPAFATIQPDPFDTKLPRITAADIQYLQASLSEQLADRLHIPKDVPMPHIISAPINYDESPQEDTEDLDDRRSLNPTPPSSPTRPQQEEGD